MEEMKAHPQIACKMTVGEAISQSLWKKAEVYVLNKSDYDWKLAMHSDGLHYYPN